MPIYMAHKLALRLTEVRKNGTLPWLRPDGKTQVTVEYHYGKPVRIDTVLISTQHDPDVSHNEIEEALTENVIMPTLRYRNITDILPTHRFQISWVTQIHIELPTGQNAGLRLFLYGRYLSPATAADLG